MSTHAENYINSQDLEDKRQGFIKTAKLISIIVLILIIVDIFLAGFQYRQTDQRWSQEGSYFIIGVLQIIFVVVSFVIIVFGIIVLCCCERDNNKINAVRFLYINLF